MSVRRLDDPVDVRQLHRREQRQRHGLAADALGVRELSLAVAQRAIGREEVDRRIVHADADAPLRHRLDELQAGDAQPLERQQRREHVPAVSLVAPRRQAHAAHCSPHRLEIARASSRRRALNSLERGQLAQAHACGDVGACWPCRRRRAYRPRPPRSCTWPWKRCSSSGFDFLGEPPTTQPPSMVVMFLLGWKLKQTRSPKLPMRRAAPGGADRLRGVLDDAQPVPPGDRVEPVHVDGQPGKVHRHDRARARRDGRLHLVEVDVAGVEADIDEHRPGARRAR